MYNIISPLTMHLPNFFLKNSRPPRFLIIFLLFVGLMIITELILNSKNKKISKVEGQLLSIDKQKVELEKLLRQTEDELNSLKNEDQYKLNKELQSEIKNIQDTFKKVVNSYESLLDLKEKSKNTGKLDELFAQAVNFLSQRNYASSAASLTDLNGKIKLENDKITAQFKIPESLPVNNAPPSSGYRRQKVQTDVGSFMVDIVSADLNSTRVIVDTASESDCSNDCPVLSLADYASRNSAFAGVNGSYFCPSTYPQCADKKNSFDTLLMNKNKRYFNSDNNVYSTIPAAIFYGNTFRFISQSLEWGRDTGVDAVIANRSLLLLNQQIMFTAGEGKEGAKGGRSFIGGSGNTVYIGVVHNATVAESAKVLQVLGLNSALNLDNGGSTALWFGGYKVGPGRNLPNVILLLRK